MATHSRTQEVITALKYTLVLGVYLESVTHSWLKEVHFGKEVFKYNHCSLHIPKTNKTTLILMLIVVGSGMNIIIISVVNTHTSLFFM